MLVGMGIVVGLGRRVDDQGLAFADAHPAVIQAGRDVDDHRVVLADEEFVDPALGRGVLAPIVNHQLDHAVYAADVVRLLLVHVPALDDSGIRRGQVDLAEFFEDLVVLAQDFHQPAAFVRNDPQFLCFHAVDHYLTSRHSGDRYTAAFPSNNNGTQRKNPTRRRH